MLKDFLKGKTMTFIWIENEHMSKILFSFLINETTRKVF